MIAEESEEEYSNDDPANTVTITIIVKTAKIIKEQRVDSWSSVKLEFCEAVIGISQLAELLEDNTFEYYSTTKLHCSINDYEKINNLISKPLLLTVMEFIKKGKEDKAVPLCVCSIDMLPWLLNSSLKQNHLYTLYFIDSQKKTPPIPPEIEIDVSFSKLLLDSEFFRLNNIVQLTMEGCFALPDTLISTERDSFIAGFNFPLLSEIEELVLFTSGRYETLPLNESRDILWHEPSSSVVGNAVYIPNCELPPANYIEDFGDFEEEKHYEHRKVSENQPHILWNTEFRSVLSQEGLKKFKKNIIEHQFLPLEFVKVIGSATKGKKEDEGKLYFYSVAYINLAPLVFPGVNEIHGAYQLYTYSKSEIDKKTKKTLSLDESASQMFVLTHIMNKSAVKESIEKVKEKPQKQMQRISSPLVSFEDVLTGAVVDSYKFEEARTYVTFNIKLHRPLVPKRTEEDINLRIADILPIRTSFHPKTNMAAKAVEGFGTQVINIAALLLEEYKNVLQKEGTAFVGRDKHSTQDYRKSKFLYEIKKSGKYSACKEQLKYHVVKIVREKFMRKKNFATKQEFQDFTCQLYTYLIEIMHKHLNEFLCMSDFTPSYTALPDIIQLRNFAFDAVALDEFELAKKYHQQRIGRFGDNAESWIDYGIYCFCVDEDEKAVECFREALINMPQNLNALLLSGIANDLTGYSADAETFLLAAVNNAPTYFLPCTLLGLYYQNAGELSGAAVNFKKATALLAASSVSNVATYLEKVASCPIAFETYTSDANSVYLKAAEFCLENFVLIYAEKSLAIESTLKQEGLSPTYYYLLAKMYYLKGLYAEANSTIWEIINTINVDADLWSLHGHILYALNNLTNAKRSYQRAISTIKLPQDLQVVYIKLARIYMEFHEYQNAKRYYLLASKHLPSCFSWLGVGKACYYLDELIDAEEALAEANILDNTYAEVWAYLTLVCLKTGQTEAAEQCYRFTCKCCLKDESLLEEIHDLATAVGIPVTSI